MLIMLISIIAILFAGFLIVWISSPGKLPPLKDAQGNIVKNSLAEKVFVKIGGIKQGMFIRGENLDNPVVLYVHGGPGTPMLQFVSFLEKANAEHLEKYFTICYWDQRGSGMTYTKDTDPAMMTLDQMIEDTREVTEYLKQRFNQKKIFIMGHSWGSYLGVKTIEKYPENYIAYIGIGQVTNQAQSERFAYDYMLSRAKKEHDIDVANAFEKYNQDSYIENLLHLGDALKLRTNTLIKYGVAHLHKFPSGIKTFNEAILKALFIFKGYTIKEKINWFLGADFSMIHLWSLILKDNLFESSAKFKIPFYIAQGNYDYQVSQVLAKKYFELIDAPKKAYFAFSDSAHSPNMEEAEKFIEVFKKISVDSSC